MLLIRDYYLPKEKFFLQIFAEGACIYDGNILENFEGINDVKTCKAACQITPKSNYYTYDELFKLCICYDSKDRHYCKFIGGPSAPSFNDCRNNTTPSPTITTSSTTTMYTTPTTKSTTTPTSIPTTTLPPTTPTPTTIPTTPTTTTPTTTPTTTSTTVSTTTMHTTIPTTSSQK